ncbi:MAG: prolipoprotein diacylglyceryl transferase [Nitrospirae bacterium CG_4_10_14_0_8_um_filter_41_23]|nr:prolipoprotein diacylglyceryl transferase [Nitrospirota bacterium]PIQ95261.1 MAG: prolipoprotein diacylglyceryl transferase [Nitrospirae bacterium CG11_big_fil_rev_8_21_14_0_20_41_14]PIV43883.1 MAG: prolipoprotein diacylglyceryl transferase [Nitrospirae bacterium CG02_land_8_20_14_3_00_41_53]PIW86512.1 MAG: prolipoprotein diacylglyceryl transferase [Nitrospirae bacterium CG_4_8_14_3_um_filter_41_47]PIY86180.1 MAG: prolipoprotein diacylglyceryl transferase [Nitrospirae bacterium CG_4_10_14_0_
MISYPDISPEIFRIGPFAVRWYGLMYLAGFVASYFLVTYQLRRKGLNLNKDIVLSLYSYLIIGLVAGARLGYVIFYNFPLYLQHPLEIFAVWQGGMSFHGGLLGSIMAGILACRKNKLAFWQMSDFLIVTAPIGLGLGRIGNFINGELYGRITNVPWAMVFPSGGPLLRHTSQIYEFLLEGVVLFIILWNLKDRQMNPGILSALFLILYSIFRFFVEFFREPDPQLGFILGPFTMGQLLSSIMVCIGVGVFYLRIRNEKDVQKKKLEEVL